MSCQCRSRRRTAFTCLTTVPAPWRHGTGLIRLAKTVKTARMKFCEFYSRRRTSSTAYLRRPNTYARVTGNIKTFGSRKYINASQIRPVRDPHEIFFHLLDVIAVQLTFDRGSVRIFPLSVVPLTDAPTSKGLIWLQRRPQRVEARRYLRTLPRRAINREPKMNTHNSRPSRAALFISCRINHSGPRACMLAILRRP
jgi:hypothetical protein